MQQLQTTSLSWFIQRQLFMPCIAQIPELLFEIFFEYFKQYFFFIFPTTKFYYPIWVN